MRTLRKVKPTELFVAADGPRLGREEEAVRCKSAREIATSVDWPCQVKTLLRDQNLGCEKAVSGAISWFFEHVEQGIILEDDCIADPSFFAFCGELLERYAEESKVGVITGDNFQKGRRRGDFSYYYSKHPHCWGWATWRRCWMFYRETMFDSENELNETIENFHCTKGEQEIWRRKFKMTAAREVDSWAYRWTYACWKQKLLTITPQKNLVENIGFGEEATHTLGSGNNLPKANSIEFPLSHPDSKSIRQHVKADAFTARSHFKIFRFPKFRRLLVGCYKLLFRRRVKV